MQVRAMIQVFIGSTLRPLINISKAIVHVIAFMQLAIVDQFSASFTSFSTACNIYSEIQKFGLNSEEKLALSWVHHLVT